MVSGVKPHLQIGLKERKGLNYAGTAAETTNGIDDGIPPNTYHFGVERERYKNETAVPIMVQFDIVLKFYEKGRKGILILMVFVVKVEGSFHFVSVIAKVIYFNICISRVQS